MTDAPADRLFHALAAVALVVMAGVFAAANASGGVEHLDEPVPVIPAIRLDDGAPLSVGDGRPTAVFVWLPRCGACAGEAPLVEAARLRHPDVRFVGISLLPDAAGTRRAADAYGLTGELATSTGSVLDALGLASAPSFAWINAEGRLVARADGPVSARVLEREIAALRE